MSKMTTPFNQDAMLRAMHAAGLAPYRDAVDLVPDGRIRRYRVEGDKSGSRNGWAVAHADPVPHGAFGSWKTGARHFWRPDSREQLTPEQQAILRGQFEAMKRARDAAQAAAYDDAARRAAALWSRAREADPHHPYLVKRSVPPIGLRQLHDALVVPVRDVGGQLTSLQFITADCQKRFMKDSRLRGAYFALGRVRRGVLLLCEGVATGLTLHAATGEGVACAFSAFNLEPVARVLRSKLPAARFLFCADADPVGIREAQRAADAVGGKVIAPIFGREVVA